MDWIRRLFSRRIQVWLVCSNGTQWAKAVVYGKPKWPFLLGPFRSEVDAEETADFMNSERPDPIWYEAERATRLADDDDSGDAWKQA
jgi:hypothetical protein